MAVDQAGQADGLQRAEARLVADPLVHDVVAGILQQQRDAAGGADRAARGLLQAGEVAQQRGLSRAVAAHQRDALAWGEREVDAAQDGAAALELLPHAARSHGGRRCAAAQPTPTQIAARARARVRTGKRAGGRLPRESVGAQRRAGLLDAGGERPQSCAQEQPRRGRQQRRGALGRPAERLARGGVAGDRPVLDDDHAVGVRQAALEAMLGEDDRRPPLLVEPAQQPDELVAGDGIELRRRLVEQHQRRAPGERRAERDALQLPARQLVRRAVEQVGDPQRQRGLLDAAGDRGGGKALVLEREGQLGAHRAHHDLRLGILQQRPRDGREIAGAVVARVQAADDDPADGGTPVEVRHEAAGGPQDRGLPRCREAGQDDELAGLDLQADLAQGGSVRVRIRVAEALEGERAHGSIPRRPAIGSSATTTIAAASTISGPPIDAVMRGYGSSDATPVASAQTFRAISAHAAAPTDRS